MPGMGKTSAKPTNVGKPQYKKSGKTVKDRLTGLIGKAKRGLRETFIGSKLARSVAKSRTTKAVKKGISIQPTANMEDRQKNGETLKRGIEGMARRANLDEETYNKLMQMDPIALERMYQSNKLVFEITFSYQGVETDPETGAYILNDDKKDEFDFLIEQYNKMFPDKAV